jgi:hypothetical protein
MLPHFVNLISTNVENEPVYKNLFEVVVTLPPIIETTNSSRVILENVTKFTSLNDTIKKLDSEDQQFKYSFRNYLKTPSDTHITFSLTMNLNQSDKKVMETWALMKRWYDLIWNSQTGELHYKSDYIGNVTVQVHDRTGEVIRRVDFVNAFVKGISQFTFDWANTGIIKNVDVSFVADYWIDTYFDIV